MGLRQIYAFALSKILEVKPPPAADRQVGRPGVVKVSCCISHVCEPENNGYLEQSNLAGRLPGNYRTDTHGTWIQRSYSSSSLAILERLVRMAPPWNVTARVSYLPRCMASGDRGRSCLRFTADGSLAGQRWGPILCPWQAVSSLVNNSSAHNASKHTFSPLLGLRHIYFLTYQ
jgi:hypothetical protein